MADYRNDFLDLAASCGVLRFGDFTLKSGRRSPYFFNLGAVSSGLALRRLAQCYVALLDASGVEFDLLFGPAYKGIPLAAAVATVLAEDGRDVAFAYNRKEAKDHGEGGSLVGAPLEGRVAIIDDILTAGTAIRESIRLIRAAGATPVTALLAFDRMERGQRELSAVQELEQEQNIAVHCIANLDQLADWLAVSGNPAQQQAIAAYRAEFGVITSA